MPRCYASTHLDTRSIEIMIFNISAAFYGVLPIVFIHIHTRNPPWSSVHARLLCYYHQLPQVYYMSAEVCYICHIPINLFTTRIPRQRILVTQRFNAVEMFYIVIEAWRTFYGNNYGETDQNIHGFTSTFTTYRNVRVPERYVAVSKWTSLFKLKRGAKYQVLWIIKEVYVLLFTYVLKYQNGNVILWVFWQEISVLSPKWRQFKEIIQTHQDMSIDDKKFKCYVKSQIAKIICHNHIDICASKNVFPNTV